MTKTYKELLGWMKKIDHKIGIQNGRVRKAELDIALLKQRHELEEKAEEDKKELIDKMDQWSRKKLLLVASVVITIIMFLAQIIFELLKYKIMN